MNDIELQERIAEQMDVGELMQQLLTLEEEMGAADSLVDQNFLRAQYEHVVEDLVRCTDAKEQKQTREAWLERIS